MKTLPSDPMTYAAIAKWTGMNEGALRQRHREKRMPPADGHIGTKPFWMPVTVLRWAPDGRVPDARRTRSDLGATRGPRQATLARYRPLN